MSNAIATLTTHIVYKVGNSMGIERFSDEVCLALAESAKRTLVYMADDFSTEVGSVVSASVDDEGVLVSIQFNSAELLGRAARLSAVPVMRVDRFHIEGATRHVDSAKILSVVFVSKMEAA